MNTNIYELESAMSHDLSSVQSWCDEMYEQSFSSYFSETRQLYDRMQSNVHPITDEELSDILTLTPLNLFSVSEELNRFRLNYEVIKLKAKEHESDKSDTGITRTIEDKLILTAYNAVITRVSNEISFSRELIMAAKKLWDRRRSAEEANPIGDKVASTLPEYPDPDMSDMSGSSQTYIKGGI